jgi:very-short-patch-repair endonuclease
MNRVTELCRKLRNRPTEAEVQLWEALRKRQINGSKFLRQYPIFIAQAGIQYFYIADFYCAKFKLVVEVDGPIHEFKKEYDLNRDLVINSLGIKVIRFKNDEVINRIEDVIDTVLKHLS